MTASIRKLIRHLLTLLMVSVIPATVLVAVTARPAEAATITRTYEISQPERLFVQYAARARIDAMNNPGTVMNFAKMRRVFAPVPNKWEVSWRRQMAAGARAQGTRISNISSAESAAVNIMISQVYGSTCPKCRTLKNESVRRDGTNCSGREGLVTTTDERWVSIQYYNACQTNDLKMLLRVCAVSVGVVAGASAISGPTLPVIIGMMAGACELEREYVDTVQSNSRYNAIGVRQQRPYDVIGPNGNRRTFVGTQYFSQ